MKKYEFTGKTIEYEGHTLHQIRALRDLNIRSKRSDTNDLRGHAGDIGGWIESEDNLSHEGNCWVDDDAKVYGYASIRDDAYVGNEASVSGCNVVGNNARIVDNAIVIGFATVFGNAFIGGSAIVKGKSKIYGEATIKGMAKVQDSEIYGNATIAGTIEVYCKTLCKGLYDCDDDFREKRPEKRSYDEPFLPVDNSLSSVERRAIERRQLAYRMCDLEYLLWDDCL